MQPSVVLGTRSAKSATCTFYAILEFSVVIMSILQRIMFKFEVSSTNFAFLRSEARMSEMIEAHQDDFEAVSQRRNLCEYAFVFMTSIAC